MKVTWLLNEIPWDLVVKESWRSDLFLKRVNIVWKLSLRSSARDAHSSKREFFQNGSPHKSREKMRDVRKLPIKESFRLCVELLEESFWLHVMCVAVKESFSKMSAPTNLQRKCEMCNFTDFVTFSNARDDTCSENSL